MVSEFAATLGCKDYLEIGQPHSEECRARITTCMENDLVHANRLGDNLISRNEFANLERLPRQMQAEQMRRNFHAETRLSRQKNLRTRRGASNSSAGADVDTRSVHAGKRPLEPSGDEDMVCGMDVCDELNEQPSDVFVNDCDGETLTKWQEPHSCVMMQVKHVRKRWHGTKSSKPLKR